MASEPVESAYAELRRLRTNVSPIEGRMEDTTLRYLRRGEHWRFPQRGGRAMSRADTSWLGRSKHHIEQRRTKGSRRTDTTWTMHVCLLRGLELRCVRAERRPPHTTLRFAL